MRKLLIPAALLAAAAPGAAAPEQKIPVATPNGKPVSCLALSQIRETRVRSDDVIDFVVNGGRVYRNTLPMRCPSLGFEARFLHKTVGNDYCSTDTITVLHSDGVPRGPTCGLGEFQPVTLTPAN